MNGYKCELESGAEVAVFRGEKRWRLELRIPVTLATKDGFDAEATLEQHRLHKIVLDGDKILTAMTISDEAFLALLDMGIQLHNAEMDKALNVPTPAT